MIPGRPIRKIDHIRREHKICRFMKRRKIRPIEVTRFLGIAPCSISIRSGQIYKKHICDIEEWLVQNYGYKV